MEDRRKLGIATLGALKQHPRISAFRRFIEGSHLSYFTPGRLLLRFNDKGFEAPFYAQQVSDGTLKVFAYRLLLEDPTPPPFLYIEEPENGLYHKLLESLANQFRDHAIVYTESALRFLLRRTSHILLTR